MKYIELNSGYKMPMMGLGTWKSDKEKLKHSIMFAIETGYRHIDCAAAYDNEKVVGDALDEVLRSGKIKRKELFITSKLWNDSHLKNDVRPALEKTLNDLKLEYLDLYLIHWPVASEKNTGYLIPLADAPLSETWAEMEKAVDDGLFHVYAIDTVDDGIEILTGKTAGKPDKDGNYPKGTVNYMVQKSLDEYYERYVKFAKETHGCMAG